MVVRGGTAKHAWSVGTRFRNFLPRSKTLGLIIVEKAREQLQAGINSPVNHGRDGR